jgi:hypothetical protein
MSRKKAKKPQKSYGERIVALVGKSWVSTGKIIKSVGCPPRAARRVLRGLVKARQLKSVKVQRERYFAAPGTKAAPPKTEATSKGNGRTRTRSRKAAKSKKGGGSSKKSKRKAAVPVQPRKPPNKAKKPPVRNKKSPAAVSAKSDGKKKPRASGKHGTPASAPSSTDEVVQAATKTVEQSGQAEQTSLLS